MSKHPLPGILPRREFCLSALAATGLAGSGLLSAELFAQGAAPKSEKKEGPKEPKALTLETKDGVALKATYFPGAHGKETVPIIMLHGWEQRGVVWEPLAIYFQGTLGHAVIIPDLRGHGQSLNQSIGGESRQLDLEDFKPADMEAMVWDVQACKKFLQEENNKEELNLEMLTVIGAEYGALLAMQFAALDWSWPQLTTGKQGQDVKGLALLTPIDQFKRVSAAQAVADLRGPAVSGRFSSLILAGKEDRSGYSDAKRLHKKLEALFPNDFKEEACFLVTPETNSHGSQLIEPQRKLGTEQVLNNFIQRRLVERMSEFEWSERKRPLQQ